MPGWDACGRAPLGPVKDGVDDIRFGCMYGPLDTRLAGFLWAAKTVGTFSSMGVVTKEVVEPGSKLFLLFL